MSVLPGVGTVSSAVGGLSGWAASVFGGVDVTQLGDPAAGFPAVGFFDGSALGGFAGEAGRAGVAALSFFFLSSSSSVWMRSSICSSFFATSSFVTGGSSTDDLTAVWAYASPPPMIAAEVSKAAIVRLLAAFGRRTEERFESGCDNK